MSLSERLPPFRFSRLTQPPSSSSFMDFFRPDVEHSRMSAMNCCERLT